MKKLIFFLTFLTTFSFYSCAPSREKMIEKISKMEEGVKNSSKVDSNEVSALLSAYQNFATRHSDDSLAPEYLYKAGGLAVGFGRGVQAVEIFENIIQAYPSYRNVPECCFMEAFAYENTIGNIAKANEYYNKFLDLYPDHELAKDASAAIKYLGKSPEEMVRDFEKMNSDSINSAAEK